MTAAAATHLCMTHSPLVTRVFEAAMRREAVPPASTGFLSRRATPFPGRGLLVDDTSDAMDLAYRKLDRTAYHAARAGLDEAIRALCGDAPFEAYVPHLNKMIYQEIVLHPRCRAWSFVEEGYPPMNWRSRMNARITPAKILRSWLRDFRVGPRYRLTRPMFDHSLPGYRAAYAISKLAFRGMPGRVDVAPDLPPLPAGQPPGRNLLILDTSYLHQGLEWKNYEQAVIGILESSVSREAPLLMKFHPADTEAQARYEALVSHLRDFGFPSIERAPRDFQIEENLTAADLLVFGTTSLGYYMALAGARVRCFADRIAGLSFEDWIRRGDLPEDFRSVTGIDPPPARDWP